MISPSEREVLEDIADIQSRALDHLIAMLPECPPYVATGYRDLSTCPLCGGSGRIADDMQCLRCQ